MKKKTYPECSVEGCAEEGRQKGMCKKHYDREYQRQRALWKKASPPADQPLIITLDFSDRPELYNKLIKLAHDDFRTPENHIMWWINLHYKDRELLLNEKQKS